MSDHATLLTLLKQRSGWNELSAALEHGETAEQLLQQTHSQESLFPSVDDTQLDPARAALREWEQQGIRVTTVLDRDYPPQLRTIHQTPPVLFYRGTLSTVDHRGVAVIGTRRASDEGLAAAGRIAAGLTENGTPVISGLASGVDTAAHRGAVSAGGRTVAVIGTGINRFYPRENESLQRELASKHLVLSQFWPDSFPSKTSFPMRNAVMSGMAAATVVVEAPWRSGARVQARLALEHGRPVFLLRSLLDQEWAREYADHPGVRVVTGPDDLNEQLATLIDLQQNMEVNVREDSTRVEKYLVPVPPAGKVVCETCHTAIDGGVRRCQPCDHAAQALGGLCLDRTAVISLAPSNGQLARDLYTYKRSEIPEHIRASRAHGLSAVLSRWLDGHEGCVGDGADFDVVVPVPSTQERRGEHPLSDVVRAAVGERFRDLLSVGRTDAPDRDPVQDRFQATGVRGCRVLVVDDTLTTGARIQSASAALKLSGADYVAGVAIGRWFNPDWRGNADWLSQVKRVHWSWSRCCVEPFS